MECGAKYRIQFIVLHNNRNSAMYADCRIKCSVMWNARYSAVGFRIQDTVECGAECRIQDTEVSKIVL